MEFEGEERVRAAYAHGKGVIFVTGHFGYWELQALVHALRLRPMSVMAARALDNPYLHRLLEQMRTRTGNGVIYRQGTLRRALRVLAGRRIDWRSHRSAHSEQGRDLVDFFNRPPQPRRSLRLSLSTGARIVPPVCASARTAATAWCTNTRLSRPRATSTIRSANSHSGAPTCSRYVRRHPQLWLWMHRRWREPQVACAGG